MNPVEVEALVEKLEGQDGGLQLAATLILCHESGLELADDLVENLPGMEPEAFARALFAADLNDRDASRALALKLLLRDVG